MQVYAGPVSLRVRPGEADGALAVVAAATPQPTAALGAKVAVTLADVYGQPKYTGGAAFRVIPRVVKAPAGSQLASGYSTPLWQEAGIYAAEVSAEGVGR
eukprot:6138898-Pyramimonas_sp.AAC.1